MFVFASIILQAPKQYRQQQPHNRKLEDWKSWLLENALSPKHSVRGKLERDSEELKNINQQTVTHIVTRAKSHFLQRLNT